MSNWTENDFILGSLFTPQCSLQVSCPPVLLLQDFILIYLNTTGLGKLIHVHVSKYIYSTFTSYHTWSVYYIILNSIHIVYIYCYIFINKLGCLFDCEVCLCRKHLSKWNCIYILVLANFIYYHDTCIGIAF